MYRNKCKSFIILNKKEILKYDSHIIILKKKYDSSHNHPEKEYDVSLSLMKHKIKDGIEKKEYNDDIFVDELDSFYTTSFAILQNKEQEIYKIFKKLKKKKNANTCNNNIIIAESIVI
ncbi:hypothetical protein U3516DRAFT_805166 [Neocallimastix sp. 'constans']